MVYIKLEFPKPALGRMHPVSLENPPALTPVTNRPVWALT